MRLIEDVRVVQTHFREVTFIIEEVEYPHRSLADEI